MFQFLGVADTFIPDLSLKHNVSGIPVNQVLHTLLSTNNRLRSTLRILVPKRHRLGLITKLQNRNLNKPPALGHAMRQQLLDLYREDILRLQELLQRDLGTWLDADAAERQPRANAPDLIKSEARP